MRKYGISESMIHALYYDIVGNKVIIWRGGVKFKNITTVPSCVHTLHTGSCVLCVKFYNVCLVKQRTEGLNIIMGGGEGGRGRGKERQ